MMRVIRGRAGTGKTTAMIHNLARLKPFEEEAVVLVPDQATLDYELKLMEVLQTEGLLSIRVFSFSRFVDDILKQTAYNPHALPLLDDVGTAMLIGRALRDHEGALAIFGRGSGRAGFLERLSSLFHEFIQSGITEIELRQLAQQTSDVHFSEKLNILADLFETFNGELENRYQHSELLYQLASEALKEYPGLKGLSIYIDDFSGFTHHEIVLIKALIGEKVPVTIALTDGEDSHVFASPTRTLKGLMKIAEEMEVPCEVETIEGGTKGTKSPVLQALEQNLYAVPFHKYEGEVDDIILSKGRDPYEEVEIMAEAVLLHMQRDNWRASDLTVLVSDLNAYGPLIERVFNSIGIPYFIDNKRPVVNHPLIRTVLAALRCVRWGYRQEDVLSLIKNGLLRFELTEAFENKCLERGLRGRRWLEPFVAYGSDSMELVDRLNDMREAIMLPLETLKKALGGSFRVDEGIASLKAWMESIGIHEAANDFETLLEEQGELDAALEYQQSEAVLDLVFNQLMQVGGSDAITCETLHELLIMGLSSHEVGIIPPSPDQVTIGSFDRSVTSSRLGVFILGLNDGLLPRQKSVKGILSNLEKQEMNQFGLEVRSELGRVNDEETLAIYKGFSAATEMLWLSYAVSDLSGRVQRPSILVDMIKQRFPKLKPTGRPKDYYEKSDHWVAPVLGLKAIKMGLPSTSEDGLRQWFNAHDEWHRRLNALDLGAYGPQLQERIDKAYAERFFGSPIVTSVSRLERFAACPFRHFVESALKPVERRTYQLQLPELGIVYHQLIERFGRAMHENYESFKDYNKSDVQKIVEGFVKEASVVKGIDLFKKSAYGKFALRRFKQVATESSWRMLQQVKKGDFRPAAYEIGFGQPLGEAVYLEGRIDRVDLYDDESGKSHARIVDYKSGGTQYDIGAVYQGIQLQLMLYLESILQQGQVLKRSTLEGAGAFYYRIHDPLIREEAGDTDVDVESRMKRLTRLDGVLIDDEAIIKAMDRELGDSDDSSVIPVKTKKGFERASSSNTVSPKVLNALMASCKEHALRYGSAMKQGEILAKPLKYKQNQACDYCAHHGICQFDAGLDKHTVRHVRTMKKQEVIHALEDPVEVEVKVGGGEDE